MSNKPFEKFDVLEKPLTILNDLSESSASVPPVEFIEIFPKKVCEILSVPICILWRKEREQDKLRIVAVAGEVDDEYKKTELDLKHPGISLLLKKDRVLSLSDVNNLKSSTRLANLEEINKRKWISLLSAPLKVGEQIVGIINVFTSTKRFFQSWEKNVFNILANQAALSFEKADLLKEKEELERDREKPQKLTDIIQEMTIISAPDELLKSLLDGALSLVSSAHGWISRLNYHTGELNIVEKNRELKNSPKLRLGVGISGKSLVDEKPIRVNDVFSPQWQGIYIKYWQDTRSEIAIPILIDRVPVRVGRETQLGSKLFGVLNIESSNVNAFSPADEERLWLLARFAAMLLDRLEYDQKLDRLRLMEQEFFHQFNYDKIIQTVIEGLTKILEFEVVNISLVNSERTKIKTEYFWRTGFSERQVEKFKQIAVHNLDSDDIQADIVNSRQIEVPSINDPRFDPTIYKLFSHERFIRVFMPMLKSSSDQVLGTVEIGYQRKYRKYIYERDVQVLENFVNYAAHALERKVTGQIEKIIHEFKSPIAGIRNNASFLQRRLKQLDQDYIDIKFGDILLDGEILLRQVGELEYILGSGNSQKLKFRRTVIFRDVVIKTINQLKPQLREFSFSISNIKYNPEYSRRIIVYTDPFKVNQVVYNLLTNSIKYAYKEPNKFQILIELIEEKDDFIIEFSDWGIGIKPEDTTKIFQEGFRSSEAIKKDVNGSGLGLTISKNIMLQLGGDLKLVRNYNPTIFHMVIPKNARK